MTLKNVGRQTCFDVKKSGRQTCFNVKTIGRQTNALTSKTIVTPKNVLTSKTYLTLKNVGRQTCFDIPHGSSSLSRHKRELARERLSIVVVAVARIFYDGNDEACLEAQGALWAALLALIC